MTAESNRRLASVGSWLLVLLGGLGAGSVAGLGLSTLILGPHHGGGYTALFVGAPLGALAGLGLTAWLGAGPDVKKRSYAGLGALGLGLAGWFGLALLVEAQIISW